MNVAVKLYQDVVAKPEGIPALWPAEVIELGESSVLPAGAWALMSAEAFEEYIRYHKPAYDVWANAQPAPARTYVDP